MLILELSGKKIREKNFYVMNLYNSLHRSVQKREDARIVTSSTSSMQKSSIVLGDFNIHYNGWDLHTQNHTEVAHQFVE